MTDAKLRTFKLCLARRPPTQGPPALLCVLQQQNTHALLLESAKLHRRSAGQDTPIADDALNWALAAAALSRTAALLQSALRATRQRILGRPP